LQKSTRKLSFVLPSFTSPFLSYQDDSPQILVFTSQRSPLFGSSLPPRCPPSPHLRHRNHSPRPESLSGFASLTISIPVHCAHLRRVRDFQPFFPNEQPSRKPDLKLPFSLFFDDQRDGMNARFCFMRLLKFSGPAGGQDIRHPFPDFCDLFLFLFLVAAQPFGMEAASSLPSTPKDPVTFLPFFPRAKAVSGMLAFGESISLTFFPPFP